MGRAWDASIIRRGGGGITTRIRNTGICFFVPRTFRIRIRVCADVIIFVSSSLLYIRIWFWRKKEFPCLVGKARKGCPFLEVTLALRLETAKASIASRSTIKLNVLELVAGTQIGGGCVCLAKDSHRWECHLNTNFLCLLREAIMQYRRAKQSRTDTSAVTHGQGRARVCNDGNDGKLKKFCPRLHLTDR